MTENAKHTLTLQQVADRLLAWAETEDGIGDRSIAQDREDARNRAENYRALRYGVLHGIEENERAWAVLNHRAGAKRPCDYCGAIAGEPCAADCATWFGQCPCPEHNGMARALQFLVDAAEAEPAMAIYRAHIEQAKAALAAVRP